MTKFYNPYHFVPVDSSGSTSDLPRSDFEKPKINHIWHDRYTTEPNTNGKPLYFSGRIISCLTTEDPIVIGNEQNEKSDNEFKKKEDQPTRVKPFEIIKGKPIIPATSIKGLISSLAEAASNSALRVLENQTLSYRVGMNRLGAGTTYGHFRKISPEKLPFDKDRKTVSIAEQIFGFVEQNPDSQTGKTQEALAFAGRVRFSFGIICPEVSEPYEKEVTLKILGSPKPPQPALYFKQAGNNAGWISPEALNSSQSIPQGRKFYLHKQEQDIKSWETKYKDNKFKNQKSMVKPIKAGVSFYFHIDFENLSRIELGLLCYALRPADAYRHKIGMGKPIGLGKVRIDPLGLLLIDRGKRYREADLFTTTRYHSAWLSLLANQESWPESYAREKKYVTQGFNQCDSIFNFRDEFRNTMNASIRNALELIGDPANTRYHQVHTPQVAGKNLEIETYRWFNENKKHGPHNQFLPPITKDTRQLPTLDDTWSSTTGTPATGHK
jgi:CRISPR/Cas system CSM-associated protein Csm3 (group 7 of RAMP superfamily)